MDFKAAIRTIPDYPKKGIMFRDITTLLGNPRAFRAPSTQLVQPYAGVKIDKVAGIEARGFILGGAVAHQLSVGFVPIRKKGKLPHTVIGEDYDLEYGKDRVEIHADAVQQGRQRHRHRRPDRHRRHLPSPPSSFWNAPARRSWAAPSSSTCRNWAAPTRSARSARMSRHW